MDGARFRQIEFDALRGCLFVRGRRVDLDRSSAAVLAALIAADGELVDKDRLLEAGWPGRLVQENSLTKAIGRLRQALGEDGAAIKTVHGRGYWLTSKIVQAATPRAWLPGRAANSRRAALVLGAVAFGGLAILGISALSSGSQHPINGEAADSLGRVLWVDDHPENNRAEERFLEERRIGVYRVASTEDALALLEMYAYGAVISDMGRGQQPLAGLNLLRAMRARQDHRPFVLYTVYASEAQRKQITEAGGQGVVERPEELYAAILPLFGAGPPEP
jgi:DNA-binding response OmpR family regulator